MFAFCFNPSITKPIFMQKLITFCKECITVVETLNTLLV